MTTYPEPGELFWHRPWKCWVVVAPDYIARTEPYDLRAAEEVAVWRFVPGQFPDGATVKVASLQEPAERFEEAVPMTTFD